MTTTSKWESEIVQRLQHLDPVNVSTIRNLRRECSKQLAHLPGVLVIQLAVNLLHTRKFGTRLVAYELVHHHREAARSLNSRTLKLLGDGIDSWDSVDTFACYLAGPAWREQQVPDSLIELWSRSKDRWWRRAAVVSTVALNNKARGGRGDVDRTLNICALTVADRDDMVVKALSWALRELAKRDSTAVQAFLRSNEGLLAPRVLREVNNKLRTGLKNPRVR